MDWLSFIRCLEAYICNKAKRKGWKVFKVVGMFLKIKEHEIIFFMY